MMNEDQHWYISITKQYEYQALDGYYFFSLFHCYWYDFCSRLFDRLDWCSGNKKKTHFCLESFFNDFNTFSDFLFNIFFFNINFLFSYVDVGNERRRIGEKKAVSVINIEICFEWTRTVKFISNW